MTTYPIGDIAKLNPFARCQFGEDEIIEIRQLRQQGWTQQSIADHFGCNQGTIANIVNGRSYRHFGGPIEVPRQRRGTVNSKLYSPNLNPDAVRDIRKQHANGVSGKKIADQYNISHSTVYQIIHGITWTEVK